MNRTFLGRTATCSPPACARHARSAGPLTQGPGGIGAISSGSDGVLCKAFNDAVAAWCSASRVKGQGETFNDYYFTALANQGPRGAALAQTIAREVPIVIGAAGGVQMLGAAAMAAPPSGTSW